MLPDKWDYHRDHVMANDATWEDAVAHMDSGAIAQWNEEQRPRWLRWDVLPAPAARKKIRALRLRWSGELGAATFPHAVGRLGGLEVLSMPLAFASTLQSRDLPAGVRSLSFDEPGGGTRATVSAGVVFRSVQHVSAVTGELRFERGAFPALTDASLLLGARSPVPAALAAGKRLRRLDLRPVHDAAALAPFAGTKLRSIGILGGRLASLAPIARFSSLTEFYAKNLPRLADIRALASLPELRSVSLLYCNAVEDLRPLLRLPKLERLTLVSCKRIRLRPVARALQELGLSKLAITGPRHLYRDGDAWVLKTE